jgi:hypothetical protein
MRLTEAAMEEDSKSSASGDEKNIVAGLSASDRIC